jgi:hypothetical protein
MDDASTMNRAVESAARDLDAHLKSLRRKLERAALRGEPVERLRARIRREEEQLKRMRAYGQGLSNARRPE